MSDKKLKALIVDDTSFYRMILVEILGKFSNITIVGTAENGMDALNKISSLKPDIVTLDVEMPVMDGIQVLENLYKKEVELPGVIMVSTVTKRGAEVTIKALELGAFDFISKPSGSEGVEESRELIRRQLFPMINAWSSHKKLRSLRKLHRKQGSPVLEKKEITVHHTPKKIDIVVIGVSTGGPNALISVIPKLPKSFPVPILIVQHMPRLFTEELANNLDKRSPVKVKEAKDGDMISAGVVYIAKGGHQMKLIQGSKTILTINDDPPENYCKPSVDYLFRSVAHSFGKNSLALIMTGMGTDGVLGCKLMKRTGATILTQDENTSAVFGMPAAVIEAGIADKVIPLHQIAAELEKQTATLR